MARLHEYQGKAILAAYGFKVPRGFWPRGPKNQAIAAAKEVGGKKDDEVVIKIKG